jgi:hypothetical protein
MSDEYLRNLSRSLFLLSWGPRIRQSNIDRVAPLLEETFMPAGTVIFEATSPTACTS